MKRYNFKKHIILSHIYFLRLMSYEQIKFYLFDQENLSESYTDKVIKACVSDGLLEKVGHYKTESYYFITKKGIDYLREYGVIPIGKQNPISVFQLYTAAKLRISSNYVAHQLSLNHFVLQFHTMFPHVEFEYYDEFFVSSLFSHIRPDGILKIGNTYFFLEMDMNTERKTRLKNKWEHYRNFLISSEYHELNANIRVLFILGGNSSVSNRASQLREYISPYLTDLINEKFDIVIDTETNLLQYLQIHYLGHNRPFIDDFQQNGFIYSTHRFIDTSLMEYSFDSYIYMVDSSNKLIQYNGIVMEFLLDDFTYSDLYVYKKMLHFPKTSTLFRYKTKRDMQYLIIVKNEEQAISLAQQTGMFNSQIYFLTIANTKSKHILQSMFHINRYNEIKYIFP